MLLLGFVALATVVTIQILKYLNGKPGVTTPPPKRISNQAPPPSPDQTKPWTPTDLQIFGISVGAAAVIGLLFFGARYLVQRFSGGKDDNENDRLDETLDSIISLAAAKTTSEADAVPYEFVRDLVSAVKDSDLTPEDKNEVYKKLLQWTSGAKPELEKIEKRNGDFPLKLGDKWKNDLSLDDEVLQKAKVLYEGRRIKRLLLEKAAADKTNDPNLIQEMERIVRDEVGKLNQVFVTDDLKKIESQVEAVIDETKALRQPITLDPAELEMQKKNEQEDMLDRASASREEVKLYGVPEKIKAYIDQPKRSLKQFRMIFKGPPGVGKSETVKQLLKGRPDLRVIRLDGANLGRLRGDAARAMKQAQRVAMFNKQQGKDSVIFLDEGDGMVKDPEFRLVFQSAMNDKDLGFILTTNNYEGLDNAVKSRGKAVEFKNPDKKTRKNIIRDEIGKRLEKFGEAVEEKTLDKLAKIEASGRDIQKAFSEVKNEGIYTYEFLERKIREAREASGKKNKGVIRRAYDAYDAVVERRG